MKKPLAGLKAAAYYGCMLLRPFEEMEFDDKERPTLFEEFLGALGAKAVDFPLKIECCGSFQSVGAPEVATECAYKILGSAIKNGAEAARFDLPHVHLQHRSQTGGHQSEISRLQRGPCPLFYPAPRDCHGTGSSEAWVLNRMR